MEPGLELVSQSHRCLWIVLMIQDYAFFQSFGVLASEIIPASRVEIDNDRQRPFVCDLDLFRVCVPLVGFYLV